MRLGLVFSVLLLAFGFDCVGQLNRCPQKISSQLSSLEARHQALLKVANGYVFQQSYTLENSETLFPPCPDLAQYKSSQADKPNTTGRLFDHELLTQEQEVAAFHRMNLMRYRAHQIALRLSEKPVAIAEPERRQLIELAENYLEQAAEVRNTIWRMNLRLLDAPAKYFASRLEPYDSLAGYEEASAIGALKLSIAIDKFDVARGFRFSTYARTAITNALKQAVNLRHREQRGQISDFELENVEGVDIAYPEVHEARTFALELLSSNRLTQKEKAVLVMKFGLSGEPPLSLNEIARQLHMAQQTARNLQDSAIRKLRELIE